MSFSLNKLPVVRTIDPRLHFGKEKNYSAVSGASQISWRPFSTTSFSTSAINFSAPPPNPSIAIDPKVYIVLPVGLSFTGTTAGGSVTANLLRDGLDAFRQFPIASITQTLTVRINNSAASINLADVISAMLRYNTTFDVKEYDYSLTPSMLDYYQRYEDGIGAARNSLAFYSEEPYFTPRGAFPYTSFVQDNTNVLAKTAYVQAVLTEPVFLSPFLFGRNSEKHCSFIGVQTMDFQFTFGDLTRIWSHCPGPLAGSLSTLNANNPIVSIGQPILLFTYLTPKLLSPVPQSFPMSYYIVERYPTDVGNVLSGATSVIASNNIQLNSIPKRILVFARRSNLSQSVLTTDTFLGLNNININYNNYSGLLASASPMDLYNISKKNGVCLSWPEWSGNQFNFSAAIPPAGTTPGFQDYGQPARIQDDVNPAAINNAVPVGLVGSVLALDFGIDIGLDDLHSPGEILNSQLQITATFRNINEVEAFPVTMYIITINEGVWWINFWVQVIIKVMASLIMAGNMIEVRETLDRFSVPSINGDINMASGKLEGMVIS